MFQFDPTIHAGHLITALTIVGCAVTSWFAVQARITALEANDSRHELRMTQIETLATTERERTERKLDDLVRQQSEAVDKLRDDMQGWFMALSDKLDRKADKR
ncbi:hypothetical protein R5W24_000457 [Gemmata sp. JC717]|uniref:hypothetical protein n=1 Tax=Gemmata algarum TaxID=2975278 RepID=UPI0021BAFD9D|nr:hypothetical protein [Gemmata algarum]MDY3551381.1 hypothetical protein [Gemmata algarum]